MKRKVEVLETLKLAKYKEAEVAFKEAKKTLEDLKQWVMDNVEPGAHGPWLVCIKETEVQAYEVKAHTRKQLVVERSPQ